MLQVSTDSASNTGTASPLGLLRSAPGWWEPAASAPSSPRRCTAVAGESSASRTRIEALHPEVRVDEPTAVARSCDLLLLTVPDDMLCKS